MVEGGGSVLSKLQLVSEEQYQDSYNSKYNNFVSTWTHKLIYSF